MIYKVNIKNAWSNIEQVFTDYNSAKHYMNNYSLQDYKVYITPLDFKTIDEYSNHLIKELANMLESELN